MKKYTLSTLFLLLSCEPLDATDNAGAATTTGSATDSAMDGEECDRQKEPPKPPPFAVEVLDFKPVKANELALIEALDADGDVVATLSLSIVFGDSIDDFAGVDGVIEFDDLRRTKREHAISRLLDMSACGSSLPVPAYMQRIAHLRAQLESERITGQFVGADASDCAGELLDWLKTPEANNFAQLACSCERWATHFRADLAPIYARILAYCD